MILYNDNFIPQILVNFIFIKKCLERIFFKSKHFGNSNRREKAFRKKAFGHTDFREKFYLEKRTFSKFDSKKISVIDSLFHRNVI
jgi:hypothetical protein